MMGHLPLGRVVATPGALKLLSEAGEDAFGYLARHATGDWGELCAFDWRENERALRTGERVLNPRMSARPEPTSPRRTLTVRGRGVASADPDLVVLSFNIVGRDPSYSAAVENLNRRVEALRADLEVAGVERSRLKTTGFDVEEQRRYDRDRKEHVFVGYEASHGLQLELPLEKELLNDVLGRMARSASEASVDVSFDVSDRKGLRRRAMRAAVEDAQESAQVLAEASGATLGEMVMLDYSFVEVRTRRFSYAHRLRGRLMEDNAPTPDVEPEALDAEEGVTIVWEIS
jgi:uncharacterized protein